MLGSSNQNSHNFGDNTNVSGDIIGGDNNKIIYHIHKEILPIYKEEITSRGLLITSPYKSLNVFEYRDKDLFFGRDNFIKTLVDELKQTNLILLLGASGSGKSSVVRAGLIPCLYEKYKSDFIDWIFNPYKDPFESFY
ncbi:MAG: ATP-binding protein [Xenococcaceae cyanobacterium]